MEGSVLSFLKAEWKVSDTGSAHWASSLNIVNKDQMPKVVFESVDDTIFTKKVRVDRLLTAGYCWKIIKIIWNILGLMLENHKNYIKYFLHMGWAFIFEFRSG